MKIYKLLFLTALSCFAVSCTQDNLEQSTTNDTTVRLASDQFDNSYLGIYKGVFTTNDGLTRGTVEVSLSPTNGALAQIKLNTGQIIALRSSTIKVTEDNTVSNLSFSSEGISSIDASLKFSVDGNGSNPIISNVVFDNQESNIMIAKNLSRVPATPITGTYDCTDCASQGVGFPNNRTWNVMTVGAGNNQTYMTQIAYGNRVYTSNDGIQDGCTTFMGFDICAIEGSASILGYDVDWIGTHIYDSSDYLACSEVSGTWSSNYGGGVNGTFQSDNDCDDSVFAFPFDLDLSCGEYMVDNGLENNYANNSSDTYIIDAGAGNTVSLEFVEFNVEFSWDFVRVYDGADATATEITMSVGGNSVYVNGSNPARNGFTGTGSNSLAGDSVVSSGQYMTVVFESDSSVQRPGFVAEVFCNSTRVNSGEQKTSLNHTPTLDFSTSSNTKSID